MIGKTKTSHDLASVVSGHAAVAQVMTSQDLETSLRMSVTNKIDIVIIDFFLKDGTALDYLQHQSLTNRHHEVVIVLIDNASYPMSFCAYRKGAFQVFIKDEKKLYCNLIQKFITRLCQREVEGDNIVGKQVNINHALIGVNLQCQIDFLNTAALGYLSKPFAELIGSNVFQMMSGLGEPEKDLIKDSIALAQTTLQPQPIGSVRFAGIEHDLTKVDLMVHPIFLGKDSLKGFIISMQESVFAQGNRAANEWVQNSDTLTGALNHEAFLNRLHHTLIYSSRYEQSCAILHIDVDGFKTINDALGHELANQLLKMIANRITGLIREVDIIARVGADEFILVLPHTNKPEDSACMADKIMKAFKKPFILEEEQHFLTISTGIALFPQDANNMGNILQCADSALSLAKNKGKNNYQFYKADVTRAATNIVSLANDLHVALEKNQFELYFQPQVSVTDFNIIGLEALIRWHHPEKGMISPALFIPIAEQMGMICDIGFWVIEHACQSITWFESQGYTDFVLGVNLSVNQFMREEFIDEIKACIQRYGVLPERIEFEITESIFAHDTPHIIDKLNILKTMGFQLVMDDFGTGYSCLSYLKDLPLDGIKVDRAFVSSMDGEDKHKFIAIISAIVTLAQQLNIKTLAEGIENFEQAQYLTELGCNHLQGFYFSKPLPAGGCLQFLQQLASQNPSNSNAG